MNHLGNQMRPLFFIKAMLFSLLLNACSQAQTSDDVANSDSNCGLSAEVEDLVRLINEARSDTQYCGSKKLKPSAPLILNCSLQRSAQGHANTLATKDRLSHVGASNSSLGTRVTASGYKWSAVSENIAKGHSAASSLFENWRASKHHCKNLFKAKYQEIGVARKGQYWVAVFAKPQ